MKFLFVLLMGLPALTMAQLKASEGAFSNRIDLRWTAVSNAASYGVERIFDAPRAEVKGRAVPLAPTVLTQTRALQYSDAPSPPGRQRYIVTAYDSSSNVLQTLETTGWRQITDKEFFLEFQKGIDTSLPRIRSMKMLNFWGEKVEGWRGGHLVYKTSGIFRRPIRIGITYTNFTDQYLTLTGDYEVQIFKIIGQRGRLVGTIQVDGIYKGTVTHDLVIEKGQSSDGGVYRVNREGRESVFPWNVTSHPLDDSQYEKNLKNTMKTAEKEGGLD